MAGPELFSRDWWNQSTVKEAWVKRFMQPFYQEDPSLEGNVTLGIVLFNKPDGTIVPVGYTALTPHGSPHLIWNHTTEKMETKARYDFVFQYHPAYLERADVPAISDTLPKRKERYFESEQLHPFFDNLPAEGWFGQRQSEALGFNPDPVENDCEGVYERYNRLLTFGRDCPGAVSVLFAHKDLTVAEKKHTETIDAALQGRASISGKQPKLLAVMREDGKLHPTQYWETSTHIIKLPRDAMPGLIEYEYMSTIATKKLLPHDTSAEVSLSKLVLAEGRQRDILAIKRFDRSSVKDGKVHFEEVNQLLGRANAARDYGYYSDMAKLVEEKCGHEGVKQLYTRLLCQFLLGNTDNHMKNFALFANNGHSELTPDYDLAPSANYIRNSELVLGIRGEQFGTSDRSRPGTFRDHELNYKYAGLTPKTLVILGHEFGLSNEEIREASHGLRDHLESAKQAVMADPSPRLDQKIKHNNFSTHGRTCREDFCHRLDGRYKQLLGTMDRYLDILQSKRNGTGHGAGGLG